MNLRPGRKVILDSFNALDDSDLKQHMNLKRSKTITKSVIQPHQKSKIVSARSVKFAHQLSRSETSQQEPIDLKKIKENRFSGFNIKPKFKKAQSVSKGSISILLNVNDRKKRDFMNF